MIVSVRGTSGSGKSTLARRLMARALPLFEDGRLVGYQCRSFRLVGVYPDDGRAVAGVDILNRVRRRRDALFDQIARWAALGNVFYEGLLVSNEVSRTVALAKQYPSLVLVLTTPLATCREQATLRRSSPGLSLFGDEVASEALRSDRDKIGEMFREVQSAVRRLEAAGVAVEQLDWDSALVRCQELLK